METKQLKQFKSAMIYDLDRISSVDNFKYKLQIKKRQLKNNNKIIFYYDVIIIFINTSPAKENISKLLNKIKKYIYNNKLPKSYFTKTTFIYTNDKLDKVHDNFTKIKLFADY